jgi:CBS domain-containing protein
MKVREVMTRPPLTCRRDTTLATASRRLRDSGCGSLAVLSDRGRLVGILTDRDIAMAVAEEREPGPRRVEEAMTARVHTCHPDDDVAVALERMASAKIRRLPVVDGGDVKGMVSIDDIVLWGAQHGGVTAQALTRALRSICTRRAACTQGEPPPF